MYRTEPSIAVGDVAESSLELRPGALVEGELVAEV